MARIGCKGGKIGGKRRAANVTEEQQELINRFASEQRAKVISQFTIRPPKPMIKSITIATI